MYFFTTLAACGILFIYNCFFFNYTFSALIFRWYSIQSGLRVLILSPSRSQDKDSRHRLTETPSGGLSATRLRCWCFCRCCWGFRAFQHRASSFLVSISLTLFFNNPFVELRLRVPIDHDSTASSPLSLPSWCWFKRITFCTRRNV